jgi:ribonuclease kappa
MAFDAEVEILTEFTSDPDDPKATAKACFTAAIVYACFVGFCGCQVRYICIYCI